MSKEKLFNAGGVFAGLGLSVASLVKSWWWLSAPLLVLGITLLVVCTWLLARDIFRPGPLGNVLNSFEYGNYRTRWASSSDDVEKATKFLRDKISISPPRIDVLRTLHQRNTECIKLIEHHSGTTTELVAVVVVAPLTRSCVTAIEAKQLRRVEDANIERHVSTTWRRPAGVYLGGTAGSSKQARVWALATTQALVAAADGVPQYTRPTTADGKRVATKAGFTPIGDPSELWRR